MAEEKKDLKLSAGKGPDWWRKEISRSGDMWRDYRERARKVIKRYRDTRDGADKNQKRFNILYSNTETLGPAIYSQVPVPDIRRRWQDKDPVGRVSALVLQRATQYCMESYDFDAVLDACKLDYLLPGFAVARVKYKPYLKRTPKKDGEGKEIKDQFDEELVYHEAQTEYVGWDRFRMSRSRRYEKVWYVAFGDDLNKDEVETEFGAEIAGQLSYTRREDTEDAKEREEAEPTVRLWEVWCKRGRGRFVIADGFDGWVLKPEPDPLRLERFFPNAKPIWSISTTDTLEPIPEFMEYQDQAIELDDLTQRIDVLTSALRRRGVYDAEFGTLASMLSNQSDNNFVAINNWSTFLSKGGMEKLALEMPLEQLVGAIVALEDRRAQVKQTIYEVTGIADIVRGASDPRETKGAQEIKNRWAGFRVSTRQKKFAQFARDLIRLKAEVIAERFDQQTLSLISGVKLPMQAEKQAWQQQQQAMQVQYQQAVQAAQAQQQPPPKPPPVNLQEQKFYAQPTWEEVIKVLRSDKLRGFKIDIETDSTVQPDAENEKRSRSEFLTSAADFCQRTGFPMPHRLAGELIAFTLRAFKPGSQMEDQIEELENLQQGPTPKQQQKEKELQEREKKVKQVEATAKDEQHRQELAKKDAERERVEFDYDRQLFEMEKKFEAEMKALQEDFERQVREIATTAEDTVRGVVKDIPHQGVVQ